MNFRALVLASLVLLAGCGGTVSETKTTVETTQPPTTAQTTATTPDTTSMETTTAETTKATTTPKPENPWNKKNVTVSVRYEANKSRDIAPLVNETVEYWNNHTDEYGAYSEVTFVSTPNDRYSDIVVELVPEIESCGEDDTDTTVGCASVLDTYSTPTVPERVQVVAGYSNESTTRILKHEFGHVMGIEHGEEPMPLMEPMHRHTYLSQPDARDRELPWRQSNLTVYVDGQNWTVGEERHAPEQIERALEYYENGAEGHVPQNVTFERTDNRSAAHIVISWPDSLACTPRGDHDDVCGARWGHDIDTDDEFEYYTALDIRVGRIDDDLLGWYVGYWLAYGFGLEGEDELPPPWVDSDYETASGEWWEE